MTDYEETKRTFKLQVPEYYNFGFGVVDKWAEDETKLAFELVKKLQECVKTIRRRSWRIDELK